MPGYFERGIALIKKKQYDLALNCLKIATSKDPKNHKAWNALGIALSHLGRYYDANICFQNAIELKPSSDIYQKNFRYNKNKFKKNKRIEGRVSNLEFIGTYLILFISTISNCLIYLYNCIKNIVFPAFLHFFKKVFIFFKKITYMIIILIKRSLCSQYLFLKNFRNSVNVARLGNFFGICSGLSFGMIVVGFLIGNNTNPLILGFFEMILIISLFLVGINSVFKKPDVSIFFAIIGGFFILMMLGGLISAGELTNASEKRLAISHDNTQSGLLTINPTIIPTLKENVPAYSTEIPNVVQTFYTVAPIVTPPELELSEQRADSTQPIQQKGYSDDTFSSIPTNDGGWITKDGSYTEQNIYFDPEQKVSLFVTREPASGVLDGRTFERFIIDTKAYYSLQKYSPLSKLEDYNVIQTDHEGVTGYIFILETTSGKKADMYFLKGNEFIQMIYSAPRSKYDKYVAEVMQEVWSLV